MSLQKNKASQSIAVYAYDTGSDEPKTGDAANITAQITKDWGTPAATNDTNPTELDATNHPGVYVFDLTQAETNADAIVLSAQSSTSNIVIDPVQVFTAPPNFADAELAVKSVQPDNKPTVDASGHTEAIAPDGSNFNDLSQAEANAAADTALTDYDPPTKAELDAAFTEIKGATWSSSTDTLEAIRDRGDSAWITATGFSTHSAADVWTNGTRTLTGLGFTLAAGDFGASSLDGKGDWSTHGDPDPNGYIANLNGHTAQSGDTFAQLPTNFADLSITVTTGLVDLNDKTGFSLASSGLDSVTLPSGLITATSIASGALDGKGDWAAPMTSGTAQSATGTTITLASGESGQNQIFRDQAIRIVGGTGLGQARIITDYNGTTKEATVDQAWTTNPDATSQYEIDNGLAVLGHTTHTDAVVPTVTDVTNGVTLTAAERNATADAIFTRDMSNVEDSLGDHMLGTLVMSGLESAINGSGNLEIYKTDGATVIVTKTLTTDANADPVTGVA